MRIASIQKHVFLCALYVPFALWATWPLGPHAGDGLIDAVRVEGPLGWLTQADVLLNTWILAWEVHALATNPGAFLDANIFHPARWALARSEHVVGSLPLFAPAYLLTGNSLLGHQSAILLTFPLAAAAMYAAVWRLVGRADAAFVAGALFAFAPWRLGTLSHIPMTAAMYLPVVLLASVELVARGGRRWWLLLFGSLLLQSLCSVYLAALAFVVAIVAPLGWRLRAPAHGRRWVLPWVTALAAAAVVALASYLPYLLLGASGEIPATPRVAQEALSASPIASYVPRPGAPLAGSYPFLTLPGVLLGLFGLLGTAARRPAGGPPRLAPLRTAALAVGLTGYVLSLGPTLALGTDLRLPLPFRLLSAVPGIGALRGPARFGLLVDLAVSALAGVGVALLAGLVRRRLAHAAVVLGALGLLVLDLGRYPTPVHSIEAGSAVPAVYRWLAEHGGTSPVLELPVGVESGDFRTIYTQSRYTYFSTYHWSPVLNGYSGYPPDSFFLVMAIARRLPDARALRELVELTGLRWIVLHRALLPPATRDAWDAGLPEGVTAAARLADDVVLEVTLRPSVDLRAKLAWSPRDGPTVSGIPVQPLPDGGFRGALSELQMPSAMKVGWTAQGWVTAENRSNVVWPGLRPDPEGLVHLGYRWLDPDGRPLPTGEAPPILSRVSADLAPGERIRLPFAVQPPDRPGRYRFRVTLVQRGGAWFDERGGPAAETTLDVRP